MAPPMRLAVFLPHFTVSFENTEWVNSPKLALALEYLLGLACGRGGLAKLYCGPDAGAMEGVEGIADG